jgi:hypothetical protein
LELQANTTATDKTYNARIWKNRNLLLSFLSHMCHDSESNARVLSRKPQSHVSCNFLLCSGAGCSTGLMFPRWFLVSGAAEKKQCGLKESFVMEIDGEFRNVE